MTLGPFLFGAPLALLSLIALPVIWWILRATPPTPKEADLPSLRLLDELDPREETPARTPWWILLLRMLAATAALIGLAGPIYAPGAQTGDGNDGSFLIVIDNGWTSAPRWSELTGAASAALETTGRDTDIHLLLTAPRTLNTDPAERLSRSDASRRINSIDPLSWATDREDALARLTASGLKPARILWASNGLDPDSGEPFARSLAGIAPLSIYAAPPKGPAAITALNSDPDGVSLTLRRVSIDGVERAFVSALTLDGSALATTEANFEQGSFTGTARFVLPAAALSRVSRFAVTGRNGAGTIWLWDSTARSRRVGLVSTGQAAQPLLSDIYYVRKALEPFAEISEGSLEDLIDNAPDAIVLTDIGRIPSSQAARLEEWIETGGALIRFAGPRLAAQGDALVPTPLRRASRALGGSLAWDEPQAIAPFPDSSPFSGLTPPADALVRQQVLAQPAPDLQARTWARLTDGSPLVTADRRGQGAVILFHVTAGVEWSDLPYSGVFVEMLRRSIAAGRGEAIANDEGTYAPQLVLDGYGRLRNPPDVAAPLTATGFIDTEPSEIHPPGLYKGPAGTRALNTAADANPVVITNWPPAARLLGDAEARSWPLAGLLLTLAMLLLAVDLFIALGVAGRLPRLRGSAAALLLILIAVPMMPEAHAQTEVSDQATEAALGFHLAYVKTGNARLDDRTRAGMLGLSRILFLRTSVEPGNPHAIDLETAALELYPLIYFAVPDNPQPLSETSIERLNHYLRTGGALIIDTRKGGNPGSETNVSSLENLLAGLDAPGLIPVPNKHVLTRSFYLLKGFPGRYDQRRLWIEAIAQEGGERRGDGVSRLFVGDADWASAWAIDERGQPLVSVDGGREQREMSLRFGVNLVMYVLTGNYKEDQVHLPALLERLGEGNGTEILERDGVIPPMEDVPAEPRDD